MQMVLSQQQEHFTQMDQKLDYEIAKNGDEYTTSLQIPDTETNVDLTGTVAE